MFIYFQGEDLGTFRRNVNNDTVVFIPKGISHRAIFHPDDQKCQSLILEFSYDYITKLIRLLQKEEIGSTLFTKPQIIKCRKNEVWNLVYLINILLENRKNKDSFTNLITENSMSSIILLCLRLTQQKQSELPEQVNPLVAEAINYINKNFTRSDINPLTIATQVDCSYGHLERLFQKFSGTTLSKYIHSKRLSLASDLLRTNATLLEISYRCGYKHYSTFYKNFFNTYQISPNDYKSIMLPEENSQINL